MFNIGKRVLNTCLLNEQCDVGFSCKNETCVNMPRNCFGGYDCQPGWTCSDHRSSQRTTAQKEFTTLAIFLIPSSNKVVMYDFEQTKPSRAISNTLDTISHKVLPTVKPANKTGKNDSNQTISSDADTLSIEECNCTKPSVFRPLSLVSINNDKSKPSDEIDQHRSFCTNVSAL